MTARPSYFTFSPAAEDTDGIANDLTGAGPWTPNVAAGPGDGLAHQLSLSSAANLSAINITIVGTDADGQAVTETRAGPNANTVETTTFFKTVTTITAASTLGASTLDIGWVDEVVSQTIPLEIFNNEGPPYCQVTLTGTANFDIEDTMSDIRATSSPPPGQDSYTWLNDANFTGKSASLSAQLAVMARAIRLVTNSYSTGAVIGLAVITPL